jgi:hypothetical protein
MKFKLDMALGEKLFEESGNVAGFKVTRVHPVEGVWADFQAEKIWVQAL